MAEQVSNSDAQARAEKAFPVSWDQFHRDARVLAWRLNGAGPFQALVAVTRGGLVPAAIVAREIGIRVIDTLCVASYEHTTQGEMQVLKGLSDAVMRLGKGGFQLFDAFEVAITVGLFACLLEQGLILGFFAFSCLSLGDQLFLLAFSTRHVSTLFLFSL